MISVTRRSLVTDDVARRLLAERHLPDEAVFVVADRVTEAARELLVSERGGYLDLRGRMALRTDRLVIAADVERVNERAQRSEALNGKAGLEVAAALLMHPAQQTGIRELARELGRSPSTVSDILAALRGEELVDAKNTLTETRLFWQLAERWSTPRTQLATLPLFSDASMTAALRLGLDDFEQAGWALTDSAAAAAYEAPLLFPSGQALEFLVPDQSIVRRAITLLGTAGSATQARATVRVAPVPAATLRRVHPATGQSEWPLAHPLFVALDLAQDVGRGREILDGWTPDDRWSRVW